MKRFLRKVLAFICRTFVTDCPRCHGHFYGFHKYGKQVQIGNVTFRVLCHRCFNQLEKK